MTHIYDGIASAYDQCSSGDAAYEETLQFYTSALSQMRGGNYLELGIGSGRISLAAIRNAPVSILGIDESMEMLEKCEKSYREAGPYKGTLTLRQADFTRLDYEEKFDGAFMPFRTIGHILEDSALDDMFTGVLRALKPGGWFLFDHYIFQQEWAEKHNCTDILMYRDENITIHDRYLYDFERKTMLCEVKVNGETRMRFTFRWFSPETLLNAAEKAGFHLLSLMGTFDGEPWKENSLQQIWLFKKAGYDCLGEFPTFDIRKR